MKLSFHGRILVIATAACIAVTAVTAVQASDVKRAAVAGAFNIDTNADLNALPHLSLVRDTFFEVSSGFSNFNSSRAGGSSGTARLSVAMNDKSNLVFRANDGHFGARLLEYAWSGTNAMGSVGAGVASLLTADAQMFDIDWASRTSSDGMWSLGAGVGILKYDDDFGAPGVTPSAQSLGGDVENTVFTVRGSYGTSSGNHFSGEFMMQSPKQNSGETNEVEWDSGMNFTGYYHGMMNSGWIVNAAVYFAQTVKVKDTERDASFGAMASFGRHLHESDHGRVTGEAYVDFQSKAGANPFNNRSVDAIAVPGMRVGLTQSLGGVFDFLAGVNGYWITATGKTKEQTAPGVYGLAQDESDDPNIKGFQYYWTLGLAATFGRVTIDTQFHPEAIPTLTRFGSNDHLIAAAAATVRL